MTTNLTALYGLKQSGIWKSQTFTSSGTWLKPSNVNMIKVILVGAGGGGVSGSVQFTKADDGQASTITAQPFTISARGGQGGSVYTIANQNLSTEYGGGTGGGAESYIRQIEFYNSDTTENITRFIQGNGGRRLNPKPKAGAGPQGLELYNGGMGIAAGDSITGGGGAIYEALNTGVSIFGDYSMGGNVPGFGSGGIYGGGGGSFGNGGSGRYTDTRTNQTITQTAGIYGGGGAGYSSSGAGGGGGEILIREIPITTDAIITIGQGGAGNGQYTTAGGNGLCIIYWFE